MAGKRIVLVTGASGNIGTKLLPYLRELYDLRLVDIDPKGNPGIVKIDLSVWTDQLGEVFKGVDTVIHLAADPYENKTWEQLLPTNVDATINTFIAAERAGVRRVIFASSNHAMGGYKDKPEVTCLTVRLPPLPGTHIVARGERIDSTPYGSMKLFGERIGKCFAEASQTLSVVAIRIGWVQRGNNLSTDLPSESDPWYKAMWLSTPDLCQLIGKSIECKLTDRFVLINGMSGNAPMVWDLEQTQATVGYVPTDGLRLS
jgi:NAD+ dependent glucose-6-phosphate dehydrogenase